MKPEPESKVSVRRVVDCPTEGAGGGGGGGGEGGGEGGEGGEGGGEGSESGEGGEGGGITHVETEPDTPVRVMPKVQADPRT